MLRKETQPQMQPDPVVYDAAVNQCVDPQLDTLLLGMYLCSHAVT